MYVIVDTKITAIENMFRLQAVSEDDTIALLKRVYLRIYGKAVPVGAGAVFLIFQGAYPVPFLFAEYFWMALVNLLA